LRGVKNLDWMSGAEASTQDGFLASLLSSPLDDTVP
jgi:hypothetical protein